MRLEEVGKWIHISCHLGFAEQFNQFTSTFIRRASHKDFRQGLLLLHYKKLSQAVQGRDSALGRLPRWLLTLADSIENARHAGINSHYQLCFKKGNSCKLTNSYTNQDVAFDCSSLALGNAFLAAKELCGGDNWELLENWTDSIDHYHQRMIKFAKRVGGPQRVYFEGWHDHHSGCSLSAKLLKERDEIYQNCVVGLRLDVVGNHIYRTSDSSGNESK